MVAVNQKLHNPHFFDAKKSQSRSAAHPEFRRPICAFNCDTIEVDGHDLSALKTALAKPAVPNAPKVVVAHTTKGYGCTTLSNNIFEWHCCSKPEEMEIFLKELEAAQESNSSPPPRNSRSRTKKSSSCWATAPISIHGLAGKIPSRVHNMGICENTILSVGAGLGAQGFFPFLHTINPFLTERCLEQIKLDLCYNQFGANIVTTGASFHYAWDGATHHCYTELAILRLLPGMEVTQPGNPKELDTLIRSQYRNGKPTYFRLSDHSHKLDFPIEFGKANI